MRLGSAQTELLLVATSKVRLYTMFVSLIAYLRNIFLVESNVSKFAIGVITYQENQLIAFECKKLILITHKNMYSLSFKH